MPPNGLVGDLQNVTEALVPETAEEIEEYNAALSYAQRNAAAAAEDAAYEQEQQAEIEREYRQSALGSRAIIVDALYPATIACRKCRKRHNLQLPHRTNILSRIIQRQMVAQMEQAHGYLNPMYSVTEERKEKLVYVICLYLL